MKATSETGARALRSRRKANVTPDPTCPYRCPVCGKQLGDWHGYWACLCNVRIASLGAAAASTPRP
jgi:hypothetical protein